MINLFQTFLLMTLISCSHSGVNGKGELRFRLIKATPVASKALAKRKIVNKSNYLKLLFEQSRDPYYGTPKWTDECLKENTIGPIEETEKGIFMISQLYLNQDGLPGFCSINKNVEKRFYVLVFCEGSTEVNELTISIEENPQFGKNNLCPN